MKILRNVFMLLPLIYFSGCSECSVVEDKGNPDRLVRLLSPDGDNLWYGDSVAYNPAEVVFEHEREGILASEPAPDSRAIRLKLPVTEGGEETITMHLDSTTSHSISYNTLVYSQKCVQIYELSFVKFEGEQVCADCGTNVIILQQ